MENLRGQPIYAKVAEDDVFSTLKTGQAVTVRAFDPEPIQADRNIVAHAKNRNGQFSPVHVHLEENNSEEYTKAHERRLEALGRANVVSKNRNGAWDIPDDYLDRVRAYHKQLAKRLLDPETVLMAIRAQKKQEYEDQIIGNMAGYAICDDIPIAEVIEELPKRIEAVLIERSKGDDSRFWKTYYKAKDRLNFL